jgi:hypothetical protein
MKKLHKSLLATAVAAVMAPSVFALEAEAPSIHGSFDVSVALKLADESALAVDDAPGDQNFFGLDGEVGLDNGSTLTYAYYQGVDLADQGGFGNTYQAYLGYRMETMEVRVGTLDSPLRRVLDKSDVFSGTYADANNAFLTNTTASDAAMLLGGNETLTYAVSLDFAQTGAENPNTKDSLDAMRIGGMVDYTVSDTLGIAAGVEITNEVSTGLGVSGELTMDNDIGLVFGFELVDFDAGNTAMNIVVGGFMPMNEKGKVKAQIGLLDDDTGGDAGTYLAVGYDHQLAETVTGYFLFTTGSSLRGGGATAPVNDSNQLLGDAGATASPDDSVNNYLDTDVNGDATVFATGIKVTF